MGGLQLSVPGGPELRPCPADYRDHSAARVWDDHGEPAYWPCQTCYGYGLVIRVGLRPLTVAQRQARWSRRLARSQRLDPKLASQEAPF